MNVSFIDRLKEEIQSGLPGWDAQKLMAPPGREKNSFNHFLNQTPRESGVLIWLYPDGNKIYVRLILRAEGGVHSGQVAFPGGSAEKNDGNFWNTALREAHEEIGLSPENVSWVGALTPLFIPPSNFWVNPFIGTSEKKEDATISKAEVQSYFDVDIMQLLKPDFKGQQQVIVSTGVKMNVPVYILNGHVVWGATAMMLSEFEGLIRRVRYKT